MQLLHVLEQKGAKRKVWDLEKRRIGKKKGGIWHRKEKRKNCSDRNYRGN